MNSRFRPRYLLLFSVPVALALFSCFSRPAHAQARQTLPLPDWDFAAETDDASISATAMASPATLTPPATSAFAPVRLPHIFRQSGRPDNGAGWYRKRFTLTKADANRGLFLRLDGAATVKDVFLNGKYLGQHKGAYTASAFDLTPAAKPDGLNEIEVRVSNRDAETHNMLARSTLFYVNGGIYRQAFLIKTGEVHIAPDMGSSGVYITPTGVGPDHADLGVKTVVQNSSPTRAQVTARHTLIDPKGKVVATFSAESTLEAGQTSTLEGFGSISKPKIWELRQPQVYTVRTQIVVGGKISDEVTEPTGFRTIAFRDNRFFLNGRETQFRGVNKHEQTEYQWNAVTDDAPRAEWKMMDEMGVNMVRLAHYPHSQLELNLADQLGLAVWAENGLAGQAWAGNNPEDKAVSPDGERQTREMVRQNWNHPSILFWSCGNETIADTASHYANVIRQEDTSRLITYASEGSVPKGIDFLARNTYEGWYGGQYTGFSQLPRNAFVSETGSGEWLTHHVPYGTVLWAVDKYEPAEYSELFTEYRLQTIFKDDVQGRPMFLWWNFREFYDHKFKNNRNTKGIITLAGKPKDIFYLFQAFMQPGEPVVHLNGSNFFLRQFAADNGLKAYSNAARLTLTLNGVRQPVKLNGDYRLPDSKDSSGAITPGKAVDHVFFWKTSLRAGKNVIDVTDGMGHTDHQVIYQKTAGRAAPNDSTAIVQNLRSSNAANEAVFIDRPVAAQTPFYSDVDGSSDNTFDLIPAALEGARWIATRRLSDEKLKTDLSFRIHPNSKGATVFVMFSLGTHPTITLKKPSETIQSAAANFAKTLIAAGFTNTGQSAIWRDHDIERADAALWSRSVKAGETVNIPGETLDYVVLVK